MKPQMRKCSRRGLQLRRRLMCVPAAMLFCVPVVHAQHELILPPIGGGGGGHFVARCPQGELLTGVELWTGDDVDAIRPICGRAVMPRLVIWNPPPTLAEEKRTYVCARWPNRDDGRIYQSDGPAVVGIYVRSEGRTEVVNNIKLLCGLAGPPPQGFWNRIQGWREFNGPANDQPGREGTQECPANMVAVGIHGRSGKWLDAIGLICGAPVLTPNSSPANATPPPKKKTVIEPLTKTVVPQVSTTAAALAGTSKTSTQVQSRSAAYGVISAGQAATPAAPPPIVIEPVPALPVVFSPPLLQDGEQLWACADAAAGQADAGACSGEESAQAYCRLRDAQSAPELSLADAQPGIPARAVNGDVCAEDTCRVVSQLQCDR